MLFGIPDSRFKLSSATFSSYSSIHSRFIIMSGRRKAKSEEAEEEEVQAVYLFVESASPEEIWPHGKVLKV